MEFASDGWSFWSVENIEATQSLQVTELGNEVSWPVRSEGSIERMLSTLSVPSDASTSFRRSVTQSVLLLSTFKQPMSRTVGYASWTAWVTVSVVDEELEIPSEERSSLHPEVMFCTIDAREEFVHGS